jgi:hypothetical protein
MVACSGTTDRGRTAFINKLVSEVPKYQSRNVQDQTQKTYSEEYSAWSYKLVYSGICIIDRTLNLVHASTRRKFSFYRGT